MKRKTMARRVLAMLMSLLLLTAELQYFPGAVLTAQAGDEEVTAELPDREEKETEQPAEDEAAVAGTDTEAVAETVLSDGAFSVTVGELQYGEDGSNENGNLNAIFAPKLMADGVEISDYTVSYSFYVNGEEVELSAVPAGTELEYTVTAVAGDKEYSVSGSLTVAKRRVNVSYTPGEDAAVEGRDVAEDGSYVIPEKEVDAADFAIVPESAEGFALTIVVAAAIAGNVKLDLSDVDLTEDGHSTDVPVEAELSPDFSKNFELLGNINGDVYTKKAQYYVTFTANNNGETYTKTYAFPNYDFEGTAAQLLEQLGTTDEILHVAEYTDYYDLNGEFLDANNEIVVGWTVYADGFNGDANRKKTGYSSGYGNSAVMLNADASTYDTYEDTNTYVLNGNMDYHFVAQISKAAAEHIYVSAIPAVYYDGHEHIAIGSSKLNLKKQSADLRIKVTSAWNVEDQGKYNELTIDKDYTVSYKNNTGASMKVDEDGKFVAVKTGENRPQAIITGIGTYKGFSATVYFDILPLNIGETEWVYDFLKVDNSDDESGWLNYDGFNWNYEDFPVAYLYTSSASVSGIKNTYVLKNGKVSGITPKVSKSFTYAVKKDSSRKNYYSDDMDKYAGGSITLKKDVDYKIEVYKWNTVEGFSWELQEGINDPNALTSAGAYLMVFRGIGNYCGAIYGNGTPGEFDEGKESYLPNPLVSSATSCQFRIADSLDKDMSFAKISISKKTLKWDGDDKDGEDFGITVKDRANNVLDSGKDYTVSFVPTYKNTNGTNSGSTVSASNTYDVWVYGTEGNYYGYKKAGRVQIKGLKLNKAWFALDESNSWYITEKGDNAGITRDSDDPYYVGSVTRYNGNKREIYLGYYKYTVKSSGRSYTYSGVNSGEAIDPTSSVKLSYSVKTSSVKKIALKDAIQNGYLTFDIPKEADYNVKGAVPEYIEVETVSGSDNYTEGDSYVPSEYGGKYNYLSVNDNDGNYMGYVYLQFSIKNNKNVGQEAVVTAKVTSSSILSGSAEIGRFTVTAKDLSGGFDAYCSNTLDTAYYHNVSDVVALVTDAQKGKGNLSKPNVKLYQVYYKNGYQYAALNNKQYSVVAGDAVGSSGIAVNTLVKNGSAKGFTFAEEGTFAGIFALYEKALKAGDVSEVLIGDVPYGCNNGAVDYKAVFTGYKIEPYITSLKAGDSKLDQDSDFELGDWDYGTNTAAGTNAATFTIRPYYNEETDSYPYGGSATFKFSIAEADGVEL